MTEQEWLACDTSLEMIKFIAWNTDIDIRKSKLLILACVKQEECNFGFLKISEQYLDGEVPVEEYRLARAKTWKFVCDDSYERTMMWFIGEVFRYGWITHGWEDINLSVDLLREIVNPFYKPNVQPDTDVLNIANAIYKHKTFDELPILADALEDSGCNDVPLLMHLRENKEHVKGCWALDTVWVKHDRASVA